MYVAGFVIPVPQDKEEAYKLWSQSSATLLMEHGCLEVVESWEDNVPDGQFTDFRKAVDAQQGEKIVFSWQVWPDKASMEAVEHAMATDPQFEPPQDLPFDQRRLLLGGFRPLTVKGR